MKMQRYIQFGDKQSIVPDWVPEDATHYFPHPEYIAFNFNIDEHVYFWDIQSVAWVQNDERESDLFANSWPIKCQDVMLYEICPDCIGTGVSEKGDCSNCEPLHVVPSGITVEHGLKGFYASIEAKQENLFCRR